MLCTYPENSSCDTQNECARVRPMRLPLLRLAEHLHCVTSFYDKYKRLAAASRAHVDCEGTKERSCLYCILLRFIKLLYMLQLTDLRVGPSSVQVLLF